MPDSFSQPQPVDANREQIKFWDHMEEQGFEQQDMEYLVARFRIRKENNILASGAKYPDPFAWELALEQARNEENAYHQRLTQDHGYPDTAGMEWREAHQARLKFLMRKYPSADWELLFRGQFEGRDKKPVEAKMRPVTIQAIEHTKQTVIALTQQREELHAYGGVPAVVEEFDRTLARKKQTLEQYGVSPEELLKERQAEWSHVPLNRSESDRIAARIHDLSAFIADMAVQAPPGKGVKESELLLATRNALHIYRDALVKFGLNPADVPQSMKPADTTMHPLPHPVVLSDALPAPAPVLDPVIDPVPNPVSTPAVSPSVPPADESLLTAQEAAKILGVAYQTVLTELKGGRFPFAHRVGTQWRISRKGLQDWLEGHREDVESLKKQETVVPKSRGTKPAKQPYIRPDGKPLSF